MVLLQRCEFAGQAIAFRGGRGEFPGQGIAFAGGPCGRRFQHFQGGLETALSFLDIRHMNPRFLSAIVGPSSPRDDPKTQYPPSGTGVNRRRVGKRNRLVDGGCVGGHVAAQSGAGFRHRCNPVQAMNFSRTTSQ